MNIGRKVRRSSWDPGSEDYSELKKIRQEIAAKRLKVINLEKALVRAKSSLHSMNISLRAKHTTVAAATNTVTDISAAKEDKIELVSILWLLITFLLPWFLLFVIRQCR